MEDGSATSHSPTVVPTPWLTPTALPIYPLAWAGHRPHPALGTAFSMHGYIVIVSGD